VSPGFPWRHLASRHAVECAASWRSHLQSGGRFCKRTKCNGTNEAQPPPGAKMRFKPHAPSPDRCRIVFGSIFLPGPKARSHCRRSLSLVEFGKCSIDAFIIRDRSVQGRDPPIDGGRVCCPSCATATSHARQVPARIQWLHRRDRRARLPMELASTLFLPRMTPIEPLATRITSES
jgi:hypothetical protein